MQSRLLRWAAALAFVLALLPSLAVAQQWAGRGRAQGRVLDEAGEPLEGAKVYLRKDGNEEMGPEVILTDKKGKWSYLGLGHGQWTLVIEYEGYVGTEGSVKVSEFGSGPNIKLNLRPIPEDKSAGTLGALAEANASLAEGKFAEARVAYEKALEGIEPEFQSPVHHAIADSYRLEGKQAEALVAYEKALSGLPPEEQAPVLRGMAQSYGQQGDADKAISMLDQTLALNPSDSDSLRVIIMILVDSGREEEAQAYMDRLPEGETLDPNTLLNMGIKAYNKGEVEKALGFFDRAANENPNLAEVFYYRGLARLNRNETEGAKSDFSRLLEIAPDHPKAEEARQFLEYL